MIKKISFFHKFLLSALLIVISFIIADYYKLEVSKTLYCYFLDVSQGDAAILKIKNKNILIDCGPPKFRENGICKLLYRLKSLKIKHIDMIFISHEHKDHIGGLKEILKIYHPDKIFCSELVLPHIKGFSNHSKIVSLKRGDKITIEDDFTIKVLNPPAKIQFDDPDNNSLVLKVTYNERKILFTGDIFKDSEKELVSYYGKNLDTDILKVAHHGSDTSSFRLFLKHSSPQYSVISLGRNNTYGFPHPKTIKALAKYTHLVFRTDTMGSLLFKIKNNRIIAPDNYIYFK